MVIDLLGVHESGGRPDPGIRQDVRQPLVVTTGQTVTVRLHAVRRTGIPVQLATGEVIKLVARESTIRPSRKFFEVPFTADAARGPGYYTGAITTGMLLGLGGARGVYEVWLDTSGGAGQDLTITPLIPVSELVINGSAADAPAVS